MDLVFSAYAFCIAQNLGGRIKSGNLIFMFFGCIGGNPKLGYRIKKEYRGYPCPKILCGKMLTKNAI